ncbi:MAG: hypothetical protein ACK53L_19690 [Pirellulaceae bacterium]
MARIKLAAWKSPLGSPAERKRRGLIDYKLSYPAIGSPSRSRSPPGWGSQPAAFPEQANSSTAVAQRRSVQGITYPGNGLQPERQESLWSGICLPAA